LETLPQLKYLTRKPAHQEQASSVLVMLHGYGADAQDLMGLADALDPELLIISIQAPNRLDWGGYAWYNLFPAPVGFREDPESRLISEQMLATDIHAIIEQEAGSLKNVILLGFSQGAAMCYGLILRQELHTKGVEIDRVVALSGYLPDDVKSLDIRSSTLPRFFIGHGRFDELVKTKAADEAEALLQKAGASVEKHLYPIPHGISEEELADVAQWLKVA
jgi:phospholipase/carboxylesterase